MRFMKKININPLLRRLKYNPLKSKNQKGVALLLAVTSLVLMVYVASEVSMDSTIEYAVNSQELNRIKAILFDN